MNNRNKIFGFEESHFHENLLKLNLETALLMNKHPSVQTVFHTNLPTTNNHIASNEMTQI